MSTNSSVKNSSARVGWKDAAVGNRRFLAAVFLCLSACAYTGFEPGMTPARSASAPVQDVTRAAQQTFRATGIDSTTRVPFPQEFMTLNPFDFLGIAEGARNPMEALNLALEDIRRQLAREIGGSEIWIVEESRRTASASTSEGGESANTVSGRTERVAISESAAYVRGLRSQIKTQRIREYPDHTFGAIVIVHYPEDMIDDARLRLEETWLRRQKVAELRLERIRLRAESGYLYESLESAAAALLEFPEDRYMCELQWSEFFLHFERALQSLDLQAEADTMRVATFPAELRVKGSYRWFTDDLIPAIDIPVLIQVSEGHVIIESPLISTDETGRASFTILEWPSKPATAEMIFQVEIGRLATALYAITSTDLWQVSDYHLLSWGSKMQVTTCVQALIDEIPYSIVLTAPILHESEEWNRDKEGAYMLQLQLINHSWEPVSISTEKLVLMVLRGQGRDVEMRSVRIKDMVYYLRPHETITQTLTFTDIDQRWLRSRTERRISVVWDYTASYSAELFGARFQEGRTVFRAILK